MMATPWLESGAGIRPCRSPGGIARTAGDAATVPRGSPGQPGRVRLGQPAGLVGSDQPAGVPTQVGLAGGAGGGYRKGEPGGGRHGGH